MGKSRLDEELYRKNVLQVCGQQGIQSFSESFSPVTFPRFVHLDKGSYSVVLLAQSGHDGCIKSKDYVFKMIKMKARKNSMSIELVEVENAEVKELIAEHYYNVFQELVISTSLSNLHATLCNNQGFEYRVHGFPKVFKSSLVNETVPLEKGPIHVGQQEFTAICMEHCGESLRSCYKKLSMKQVISVVYQVLLSLAAAEATFEYEHRDLHLGNIMLRNTKNMSIHFVVASKKYRVDTEGKRAFIIDNTFARMRIGENHYYTNLTDRLSTLAKAAKDTTKVQSEQDKIYVGMYYSAMGNWAKWMARSNLDWMSFIIHRLLKHVRLSKGEDERLFAELETLHYQIKTCKTLKGVLESIDKKQVERTKAKSQFSFSNNHKTVF